MTSLAGGLSGEQSVIFPCLRVLILSGVQEHQERIFPGSQRGQSHLQCQVSLRRGALVRPPGGPAPGQPPQCRQEEVRQAVRGADRDPGGGERALG